MTKTTSQYQEGDIVSLKAIVASVNGDGQIQLSLDTHFAGQTAEAFDTDLALINRPLKHGDAVTWGARKARYGTFQNSLSDTLSIVLKQGGDASKAEDLEVVSTLELRPGSPPAEPTAPAEPAA